MKFHSTCAAFLTYAFTQLICLHVCAQQGEVAQLRNQLQQIQDQLSRLGEESSDPFGQRVRSVGRQRQSTPPPVEEDEVLQIRFYDLSDIFSVSPQYPARPPQDLASSSPLLFPTSSTSMEGGGFGGGGGGVFSIPPTQQQAQTMSLESARVSVDTLVDAIQNTVEPDEWSNTGSGNATIILLGNTLLISATDSMHIRIAGLINLFREHWGKLRTVAVEAFWIRSDSATVSQLLQSDPDSNRVVGLVDDLKWKTFFENASAQNRVAYSAAVTGHNGQTLHTLSGRQRHFVMDVRPLNSILINENGDEEPIMAGLAPVRSTLDEGAAFQVTPLTTRGGNFVILDLHTRVNEAVADSEHDEQKSSKPVLASASGSNGEIFTVELDPAEYVAYRMSTTLRCPKNRIMLAGGMTYDEHQKTEHPNLYLFVRTHVHTIEEDQSDGLSN